MDDPGTALRRAVDAARDLLYPPRCLGCSRFGARLCTRCRDDLTALRLAPGGRCPNCFALWDGPQGLNCPLCRSWGMDLDGCRAVFAMQGAPRRLVHSLKYGQVREVAAIMSPWLAPLWETRFDAAVAVPLHRRRENQRGFNQAELLLEPLGWPPMPGRLERIRHTSHQVGRHQTERWRAMSGAFRYTGPELTGLNIALVDDVVTTGATAVECARALRDGGARTVTVVAFARASEGSDE